MLPSELSGASRQFFLKATFGLDTSTVDVVGYTRQDLRDSFLKGAESGDLMVLYATRGSSSDESIRGRAFSIVEILAETKDELDSDRWQFGIPIVRAWKILFPIEVDRLAFSSYKQHRDQASLTKGVKLSPEEIAKVLALDVEKVRVLGRENEFHPEPEPNTPLAVALSPSRGFPISHGERTVIYPNGVYELYCLRLTGMPPSVLSQFGLAAGEGIFKVGISMNPEQRCGQLNSSFPPSIALKWEIMDRCTAGDGQSALTMENYLKRVLKDDPLRSLGGEFFAGSQSELLSRFKSTGPA